MNIGSHSLKVIDFRLIEGTKITKLSHLRKKKIYMGTGRLFVYCLVTMYTSQPKLPTKTSQKMKNALVGFSFCSC